MLVPRTERSGPELEDQLSFGVIARCLGRNRRILLTTMITLAVLGAIAGWVQQPIYRATVVFALVPPPFASRSSLGSLEGSLSSLGGLAGGLAGGLGGREGIATEPTVNLGVLKSADLAQQFLQNNHLTEQIGRASKAGLFGHFGGRTPPVQDAVKYFRDHVVTVTPSTSPGVFELAVEWPNPRDAAAWANSMLAFANEHLSAEEAASSERRLKFLLERLQTEHTVQVQDVLSELVAEEMKNLAVTTNADAYAFRVIDPAFVPLHKAKPHRTLLVLLAALTGLILSSLFVLARASARGTLHA